MSYTIFKYATYFTMDCPTDGKLSPLVNLRYFVEKYLTEYEFHQRFKRFLPTKRHYIYDKNTKLARFPVNTLPKLMQFLDENGISYNIYDGEVPKGKKINIKFRDDIFQDRPNQAEIISFLADENLSYMRPISAQPGSGKTGCTIKAISKIKKVALIIVGGLVDQWQLEFLKYTYLMPDDIYIIQGADSVRKLFAKKLRPKIIIGSLSTIRAYVTASEGSPYESLPTFTEMLKILGVGIKVIDECHTNFHAGTIIDLKSNVENNIYLSATYERTNKYGQKIFASIFPSDLVYNGAPYKKYVDIYLYGYSLGQMKGLKENTSRGYSQSKYELYIEGHPQIYDEFIDKVVEPLIHGHYINVKKNMQKLLILVHTVSMCERITWSLENLFPTLNIKKYTYEDPDDNLFDGVDIIVSTPKSAGVGRDIKNLKTLLLSCSLASSPLTKQILGRLRELKDDNPIMVDTYNRVLDAHRRHKDARKDIYKKLGRTFKEHQL